VQDEGWQKKYGGLYARWRPSTVNLVNGIRARYIPERIKVGTGDGVQRVSFSGCRLEFPSAIPPVRCEGRNV